MKFKENRTSPFYALPGFQLFQKKKKSVSSKTLSLPSCTHNTGLRCPPQNFRGARVFWLAKRHPEVSAGLCLCTAPYLKSRCLQCVQQKAANSSTQAPTMHRSPRVLPCWGKKSPPWRAPTWANATNHPAWGPQIKGHISEFIQCFSGRKELRKNNQAWSGVSYGVTCGENNASKCFRKDAEVTRPQASSSIMCEGDNGAKLWAKVLFMGILSNLHRPWRHLEEDKHDNYFLK